jgi:hypothetical protein
MELTSKPSLGRPYRWRRLLTSSAPAPACRLRAGQQFEGDMRKLTDYAAALASLLDAVRGGGAWRTVELLRKESLAGGWRQRWAHTANGPTLTRAARARGWRWVLEPCMKPCVQPARTRCRRRPPASPRVRASCLAPPDGVTALPELDPDAARKVLSHAYAAVVPIAPLPPPVLPLSPLLPEPTCYGPTSHAASPWMQLTLYG